LHFKITLKIKYKRFFSNAKGNFIKFSLLGFYAVKLLQIFEFVIHQLFLLVRDWSLRVTWLNIQDYYVARQIRAFSLDLSWSGFRHTDRFRGNGHKQRIFCFRKPANSKLAWPECHNKLLASSSRTGEYWPLVVFVRTSLRSVLTATTSGQYSAVRPSRSVSKRLIIPNFLNCKRCKWYSKDNKYNSFHLVQKYVRIFVFWHYLLLSQSSKISSSYALGCWLLRASNFPNRLFLFANSLMITNFNCRFHSLF